MRGNHKTTTRMSVVASRSLSIGGIIVTLFLAVIMNMLVSTRCNQLKKANGECERQLERLEDEFQRETVLWNKMLQPEQLEAALRNNGMVMRYPKAAQNIRMDRSGTVIPCQMSVALATQRAQGLRTMTASVSPARRTPSRIRSSSKRR